MAAIIAFAIFSTRKEDEISRLAWPDLDENYSRILVRDMKNPGEKNRNDIWCDLTPEALAIIRAQPRISERIFPYSTDTICAAFTRACYAVGINTEEMPAKLRLHFHDAPRRRVTPIRAGMEYPACCRRVRPPRLAIAETLHAHPTDRRQVCRLAVACRYRSGWQAMMVYVDKAFRGSSLARRGETCSREPQPARTVE